ncbi:hypothetical protein GGI35DRAFT_436708 [Trichoderma velutinum]
MVAETSQGGLLQLWESIPEDLRPSGSYTFDALAGTVASLVAKAQETSSSQCEHKNELVDALGGICTADDSWQDLLEITRKAAWKSSKKLIGNRPRPFNGAVSDYRRWKSEIRNWATLNGAVPGDVLAAAVLRNITGRAKQWSLSKDIGQYSKIDGVPASAAVALEAIFEDMDKLFIDHGARERARRKYKNARQGTRPVFEYNIYFHNLVVERGYDPEDPSSWADFDYIQSLRPGLRDEMEIWHIRHRIENKQTTLTSCMQQATFLDALYPAPKKRHQRGK